MPEGLEPQHKKKSKTAFGKKVKLKLKIGKIFEYRAKYFLKLLRRGYVTLQQNVEMKKEGIYSLKMVRKFIPSIKLLHK